jgi:hypothetical protein
VKLQSRFRALANCNPKVGSTSGKLQANLVAVSLFCSDDISISGRKGSAMTSRITASFYLVLVYAAALLFCARPQPLQLAAWTHAAAPQFLQHR